MEDILGDKELDFRGLQKHFAKNADIEELSEVRTVGRVMGHEMGHGFDNRYKN